MAVYVIVDALVGILAAASSAALAFGVLGTVGLMHLVRCRRCDHLTAAGGDTRPRSCPYCRHEHLAHPMATLHQLPLLLRHHQG